LTASSCYFLEQVLVVKIGRQRVEPTDTIIIIISFRDPFKRRSEVVSEGEQEEEV